MCFVESETQQFWYRWCHAHGFAGFFFSGLSPLIPLSPPKPFVTIHKMRPSGLEASGEGPRGWPSHCLSLGMACPLWQHFFSAPGFAPRLRCLHGFGRHAPLHRVWLTLSTDLVEHGSLLLLWGIEVKLMDVSKYLNWMVISERNLLKNVKRNRRTNFILCWSCWWLIF